MNNVVKNFAAVTAFAFSAGTAFAQTPPPPPAPAHHGILSRLFHPKPKPGVYQSNGSMAHPMNGQPGMMHHPAGSFGTRPGMTGSHSMMGGQFIGNKNSHVYHMPGDKGSLPSPKNRVYFSSAAAAQAAGYHVSGSTHSTTSHSTMMHGSMMHH
jgi:hypothetical protein